MKEHRLTIKEYAIYYATIPHKAAGRPKKGTDRCIRQRIYDARELPDTLGYEKFSGVWFIYVDSQVFAKAQKIIAEKAKINLVISE